MAATDAAAPVRPLAKCQVLAAGQRTGDLPPQEVALRGEGHRVLLGMSSI